MAYFFMLEQNTAQSYKIANIDKFIDITHFRLDSDPLTI